MDTPRSHIYHYGLWRPYKGTLTGTSGQFIEAHYFKSVPFSANCWNAELEEEGLKMQSCIPAPD